MAPGLVRQPGTVGLAPAVAGVHAPEQCGLCHAEGGVGDAPIGAETADKLLRDVRSHVRHGAAVYTDEAPAYAGLCLTHRHESVDHSQRYVDGDAHTNGVENFWTLFKRAIKGTYVAVAPFHVGRYVSEEAFRFNNRLKSDFRRFFQALTQVVGKRLTYRQLACVGDAGFMGIE